MRKRIIQVLLLSILLSSPIFAENIDKENQLKNIIAINIGYLIRAIRNGPGFGLGLWYERYINNYFSAVIESGAMGYEAKNEIEYIYFDLAAHCRFFPFASSLEKLFIENSFGYSLVSRSYKGDTANSNYFILAPGLGYKFIIGQRFIIEPSVFYSFIFGETKAPNGWSVSEKDNAFKYQIIIGGKI
jgi:hypothetical protein